MKVSSQDIAQMISSRTNTLVWEAVIILEGLDESVKSRYCPDRTYVQNIETLGRCTRPVTGTESLDERVKSAFWPDRQGWLETQSYRCNRGGGL